MKKEYLKPVVESVSLSSQEVIATENSGDDYVVGSMGTTSNPFM